MKVVSITCAAMILMAWSASAGSEPVNLVQPSAGYVYFNRAGADLAAHDADLSTCAADVYDELHPKPVDYAGGILGPLVTGLVYDALWAKGIEVRAGIDVENCMVVRGWRVVRIPDAEGAALAVLPQPELIARMTPWIGAATPYGDIVRIWNNDAIRSSSHASVKPVFFVGGQLSWKLHSKPLTSEPEVVERPGPYQAAKIDPKWPIKMPLRSLELAKISKAPPGSALIVMRIVGISIKGGRGLGISRQGANGDPRPSLQDHAPDAYGFIEYQHKTDWFIEAVQPGRWRIAGINVTRFCLGAPAFDVKAGDVIYAGTFDLTSESIVPDLALTPAKNFLAGTSAAESIQPASYVNGSREQCGTAMYAYEIPNAPFLPGYNLGSLASPSVAVPQTAPSGN